VLFHGYGAPPADLKGLAINLKEYGAPADTCYVLAAGPYSAGNGRSWYRSGEDMEKLRPKIKRLLDSLIDKSGLVPRNVFLGGFSQGATVAVDSALQYPYPVGGVLVLSASQDPSGKWGAVLSSKGAAKTAFFISHGNSDGVASPGAAAALRKMLEDNGYTVEFHSFDGGHSIPREVEQAAGGFLEKYIH
jgi:phospholipase/carboxylesterase